MVPIAAIRFAAEFSLPVVLIADFAFAVFIFKLYRSFKAYIGKETRVSLGVPVTENNEHVASW